MDWKTYFETLEDWKKLPAYRAEPRIDSFIGFILPDFMADILNDKIVGIIPELPIRLATIYPKYEGSNFADRSYKVDFYLLGYTGTNYFVEFKTDSKSRRVKQDMYLSISKRIGMKEIIDGIKKIATVSSYEVKYSHLLQKLQNLKLMDSKGNFIGSSKEIRVIYLQPSNKKREPNCIGFGDMAGWLQDNFPANGFETELAKTLMKWSKD